MVIPRRRVRLDLLQRHRGAVRSLALHSADRVAAAQRLVTGAFARAPAPGLDGGGNGVVGDRVYVSPVVAVLIVLAPDDLPVAQIAGSQQARLRPRVRPLSLLFRTVSPHVSVLARGVRGWGRRPLTHGNPPLQPRLRDLFTGFCGEG